MKIVICTLILFGFLISGCNPPPIFYWGDYSETLYAYKKSPDEKTLQAHKKSLQGIITLAPQKKQKIPPGVYAEYGVLLLKEGRESEGYECLQKEEALFPESKIFVQRLIDEYQRVKK